MNITISIFLIKAENIREEDFQFLITVFLPQTRKRVVRNGWRTFWICFHSVFHSFGFIWNIYSTLFVPLWNKCGAGKREIFLFLFHAWNNLKIWPRIGFLFFCSQLSSRKTCFGGEEKGRQKFWLGKICCFPDSFFQITTDKEFPSEKEKNCFRLSWKKEKNPFQ